MKCVGCSTEDNLVMSGVDSFVLECMDLIEKVCYDCARSSLLIKRFRETLSLQPTQA